MKLERITKLLSNKKEIEKDLSHQKQRAIG